MTRGATRAITRATASLVLLVAVPGCGRSQPTASIDNLGGEPDIAGVSVTSPEPVVDTVPTPDDEAPPETSTTVPAQADLYTVKPGDTMSLIAEQYGITVEALAQANGISDPSLINPGQQLMVPAQQGEAPPP